MDTIDLTKLSAAKLWLISTAPLSPGRSSRPARSDDSPRELPYLATALYALVPVASEAVTALSVDERWRIYVNPAWFARSSVAEVGRQLAHVVWHLLADHASRARSLDVDASCAEQWHRAADAAVHQTLGADRLSPDGLSSAQDLGLPPGRSAEEYYAQLSSLPAGSPEDPAPHAGPPHEPDEVDDSCGSGCDGVPRSHELPPEADGGLEQAAAGDIRRRVAIDYRSHVQQRGDRPGDAWRWVRDVLEPRVAWEPLLAQSVRRAVGWAAGRGDYTYTRPSRRAGGVRGAVPRVVLPGMRRPLPKVAVVVDTSGSVDDVLLGRALGEVDGALSALGATGEVTLYSCDAAVHTVQRVRRASDARLGGGGGTDLRAGLAAVERQRPRPDVLVVLTDGYTPWPPAPPAGAAVVVGLLARDGQVLPPTPPWATRIECRLD